MQVDVVVCTLLALSYRATGQFFDPLLQDDVYLNRTGAKVHGDLIGSQHELLRQVEAARMATKTFIGAQIKENLFKALRLLAEKELETMSKRHRPRQPRQDYEDYDEETTTDVGLIPQLANILKAVFGTNVNVTKYVESASKLLPRPIGTQLVGVVSLLDPNQFTTTTAPRYPITPPPVNASYISPVAATVIAATTATPSTPPTPTGPLQRLTTSTSAPVPISVIDAIFSTTWKPARPEAPETSSDNDDELRSDEEDEEEEDQRRRRSGSRQLNFQGINPMKILDGMESIWKRYNAIRENSTTAASVDTTATEHIFDDEYTTPPSRVTAALKGIRVQAEALRKGVPDLFQGAREAYKFLENLNLFLDNWESRLASVSGDDEEED